MKLNLNMRNLVMWICYGEENVIVIRRMFNKVFIEYEKLYFVGVKNK